MIHMGCPEIVCHPKMLCFPGKNGQYWMVSTTIYGQNHINHHSTVSPVARIASPNRRPSSLDPQARRYTGAAALSVLTDALRLRRETLTG